MGKCPVDVELFLALIEDEKAARFAYDLNNNTDVCKYAGFWTRPVPWQQYRDTKLRNNGVIDDGFQFVVYRKLHSTGSTVPVALLNVSNIDEEHRRADVGIMVDPSQQGKGIGKKSLEKLIKYCFTCAGLEKLYAEVYTFNSRSENLFSGCGFTKEAVLKEHDFHMGGRCDVALYGLLKETWKKNREGDMD